MAGNVHAQDTCKNQVLAADTPIPLGHGQGGSQQHCHGMHHRAFMHAIKFRIVDLIGVAHGGPWGRQALAMTPDPGILALAPLFRQLDHFLHPGAITP